MVGIDLPLCSIGHVMIGDRILYPAVPACEGISCFLWNRHSYLAAIITILYDILFPVIQLEFNCISVSGIVKGICVFVSFRLHLYRLKHRRSKSFGNCFLSDALRRYKSVDLCLSAYNFVIHRSAIQILYAVDKGIRTHIRNPFCI